MAEVETKVEVVEVSSEPPAPEAPKDVTEEKEVIPTAAPVAEEKVDDSKTLADVEKVAEPTTEKSTDGSTDRDAALARVGTEKRLSLINAWEENEKTKAENKAIKSMSAVTAWENSKKAALEAELKKLEEALEKKKAEYAEKMKNKEAMIHKQAEEKRAIVEAKKGEEILKAEEFAAKYRATGLAPKKIFGCFGP